MVGVFTSALLVTHVAVQVPGGAMADRLGARATGIAGLLAIALASLASLVTPDAALLVLCRLVAGLGTGASFIAGIALVRENRGGSLAQGLYGGVSMASAGIGLFTVPLLEAGLGWRAPFWATLAVAVTALALLVAPPVAGDRPEAVSVAESGPPVFPVTRDPALRRTAVLYSASYGVSFIVAAWTTELLERNAGVDGHLAAAAAGIILGAGIVSRPLGGWLLRAHPRHLRVIIRGALITASLGTLALIAGLPTPIALLGALLIGLAAGLPFTAAFSGAALVRPDAPARAAGWVNAAANGTALAGTPLIGLTFSLPGDGAAGFVVLAAAWLVGAAFLPRDAGIGVRCA